MFIGLAAQTLVSAVSFLSIPCNGSHEIDDNRWPDIVFWEPYVYAKMTLRSYPEYSAANYFLSRNNHYTTNKSREQPGGNTRKGNTINNRSNSTLKNNQSTISIITKPIFNFPLRHMQQRLKSWGSYPPLDDLMSELHLDLFCTKEGPTCVVVHTKFNLLI